MVTFNQLETIHVEISTNPCEPIYQSGNSHERIKKFDRSDFDHSASR